MRDDLRGDSSGQDQGNARGRHPRQAGGEKAGGEKAGGEKAGKAPVSAAKTDDRVISVAEILPDATFFAGDDILASGCTDDPDRCGPGDIFVARLTADGDGHDEVDRALARGVAGVVAERMIPTFGTPLCIVPDSSWALARLTHALAGEPVRRLKVIAITGTSGKTTTAWLAASVLAEAGLRVGVVSDLGCLSADELEPVAADFSRPEVLACWLRRFEADGCTHAVIEVSSAMLATHCLAGILCDTVVVTNLGAAHLDQHGTAAAYREVKARILDSLSPQGCLIANSDDPRVAQLIDRWLAVDGHGRVITTGLKGPADVTASPVERTLLGQTVLLRAGGHAMPVAVSTPVPSFIRDLLLAAAIGLRYQVPLERIVRGIEAAGSVSGRMEPIDRGQDHAAFIDHPTSGHALAATLGGLRRLTRGRFVVLAEAACAARLMSEGCGSDAQLSDDEYQEAGAFRRRIMRWADDCLVVPNTLMDDAGNTADLLAYARIDRLLSSLGGDDCLIILGDVSGRSLGPTEPDGDPLSLAAIVDGWLQLAHVPEPFVSGRYAA